MPGQAAVILHVIIQLCGRAAKNSKILCLADAKLATKKGKERRSAHFKLRHSFTVSSCHNNQVCLKS